MKKLLILLVFGILLPIEVLAKEYNDYNSELKYEINDSIWEEVSLNAEREFIKKKWENSDCGTLMYGSTDVWSSLTSSEKSGYSRSTFNHKLLTEEDLSVYEDVLYDMGYNIYSSDLVEYDMKMLKYSGKATYNDYYFDYLAFITINNGYMIQWQYYGETDTLCMSRLTTAVTSMHSTSVDTAMDFNFINIFINLILTILGYMLYPFIRVVLMKKIYDKDSCKKMAIWNSVIVGGIFMILTINSGGVWNAVPAFFYYSINKTLWINKKKNNIETNNSNEKQTITSQDITICECGCKVLKKYDRCPKCNKKM